MEKYQKRIERLEMDLVNQRYEYQAFIKVQHNKTQYDMKCAAVRQFKYVLNKAKIRLMSDTLYKLMKKDRKFEILQKIFKTFQKHEKDQTKD